MLLVSVGRKFVVRHVAPVAVFVRRGVLSWLCCSCAALHSWERFVGHAFLTVLWGVSVTGVLELQGLVLVAYG